MRTYKLALVGVGPWGQNYIKALAKFANIELVAVVRRKNIRPDFLPSTCKVLDSWDRLMREPLHGIVYATSTPLGNDSYYLMHNVPVMAEKPLVTATDQLSGLDYVDPKHRILVNYIHLFSDPFLELKRIVSDNKIIRICTSGFGPSKTREHFSPLWDYGPHDLSMILSLMGSEPTEIDIQTHNKSKAGHSFRINLHFGDVKTKSIVGNGTIVKSRYFSVTYLKDGQENSITYDDMAPEKLFLNGKGIDYPKTATPLENSITSFLDLIDGKKDERHGTDLTAKITKILSTYEDR